ncbi:hypothetical protein [Microseira wollei]|nr:hypothetical protein [Microseira wollei]
MPDLNETNSTMRSRWRDWIGLSDRSTSRHPRLAIALLASPPN